MPLPPTCAHVRQRDVEGAVPYAVAPVPRVIANQCSHWCGNPFSCLPLRGNCGFALPVADEAKPEFPQRSKNASKRMCAAFFGHRKAEVSAACNARR